MTSSPGSEAGYDAGTVGVSAPVMVLWRPLVSCGSTLSAGTKPFLHACLDGLRFIQTSSSVRGSFSSVSGRAACCCGGHGTQPPPSDRLKTNRHGGKALGLPPVGSSEVFVCFNQRPTNNASIAADGAILMEGLASPRTSSFPWFAGIGVRNNPPAQTLTGSADGRGSLSSRTAVRTTRNTPLAPSSHFSTPSTYLSEILGLINCLMFDGPSIKHRRRLPSRTEVNSVGNSYDVGGARVEVVGIIVIIIIHYY